MNISPWNSTMLIMIWLFCLRFWLLSQNLMLFNLWILFSYLLVVYCRIDHVRAGTVWLGHNQQWKLLQKRISWQLWTTAKGKGQRRLWKTPWLFLGGLWRAGHPNVLMNFLKHFVVYSWTSMQTFVTWFGILGHTVRELIFMIINGRLKNQLFVNGFLTCYSGFK